LSWSPARPGYETSASGSVQISGTTTTSAAVKVSIVAGGDYSFVAASGYMASPKTALTMTLSDASGKVVKTSKSNTLTLSSAESAKLASGNYTVSFSLTPPKGGTAYLTSFVLNAYQKLSPLPSKSGNADLDAILAGSYYWWHDVGQVATLSKTPITDTVKQVNGARATLYYDYLSGSEAYLSSDDKKGFAAMSEGQKSAVVSAMGYLSSLINVDFVQDSTKADIVFGTNQQDASSGYAKYPLGNGANPSVLMLDNIDGTVATNTGEQLQDKSSYAWYTLIHELGHAMGLKHPGAYNAGGGKAPPPYLSGSKDNRITTVMSYKDAPGTVNVSVAGSNSGYSYTYSGISLTSYKVLDIAALQYLYGANTSTQAQDLTVGDGFKSYQAVWAPGNGIKLDASTTTRTNVFDLRPGGYSSISILSNNDQINSIKASFTSQGVSDANAQKFAQEIATSKVLKGKLFDGKNTLGLAWGSAFQQVTGGASDDRFYAGGYSSTVIGGSGNDTLFLQGKATNWTESSIADGKTFTNKTTGSVITAKGIEMVKYYSANGSAI